jgi:IS5 family transposase
MAKPRDDRQKDLLRPALEDIIDLGHPLARLARVIDWGFLDSRFASVCAPGAGQPGLPTRLVAGLLILKHMHDLSDEALCARWLENPYYQFFCGELSFCHQLPFDRSSLTHWRRRLGEEQLVALLQESLSVAHKTGGLATRDLERVVVDTTVQPGPAPAKAGGDRAPDRCAALPSRTGKAGRSCTAQRCAAAAELSAGGQARRDHDRPLQPCPPVQAGATRHEVPAHPPRPGDPRHPPQDRRQRGTQGALRRPPRSGTSGTLPGSPAARPKIYALHAPEVECIGKGKARAPYEFGCKVSIATPATKPKGGQFVLHTKALHGNPFDGHTLGPVITELEQQTGVETRRIHVDKGYRGHNHKQKFRVWISGQVRRVTAPIRREMKRRAAVEPVIGHTKAEHRMGRNYLKGRDGDRINAVLAAAGYNFSLLLRWLARFLRALFQALITSSPAAQPA